MTKQADSVRNALQANPEGLDRFIKLIRQVAESGDVSQRFPEGEKHLSEDMAQLARALNSLMSSLETGARRQQADQTQLPGRLEAPEGVDTNENSNQESQIAGLQANHLAHDFNNIFQVVIGYSELALRHLGPNHEARPLIEEVLKTSSDASELTRRLLRKDDPGEA